MATSLLLVHLDGSKGNQMGISLSPHILPEIPPNRVLSFHSMDYKGIPNANGIFTVGDATAEMHDYSREEGRWYYSVTIESPNAYDFGLALREVFRRLGTPFEDLTPPFMVHLLEQSFIRGVKNDIRNICNLISCRWSGFCKKVALLLTR